MFEIVLQNRKTKAVFTKIFEYYWQAVKSFHRCMCSKKVQVLSINFDPNK